MSDKSFENNIHNSEIIDEFFYALESERILRRRRIIRTSAEIIILIILTFSVIAAGFISISAYEAHNMKKNILRLHVIANSDSADDQALKLKVRDEVLGYIRPKLENAENKEEIISICLKNRQKIQQISEKCVKKNGYGYNVKVEIGTDNFPTKEYPGVKLPAGDYDALCIKIGSGTGKNWWCVCFPPLCLSGSSEVNEDMISKNVSGRELELITRPNKTNVKIKFFVLELINNIKNSFK